MANQWPCKVHEVDGEQVRADWLVTAQEGNPSFEAGFTLHVCNGCLFGLLAPMFLGEGEGVVEQEVEEPDGPGLLEQVEAQEGAEKVAAARGGGRKRGAPANGADSSEVEPQAATSDVAE